MNIFANTFRNKVFLVTGKTKKMNKNIAYQTDQLSRYFTNHRVSWPQFYESERNIINRLALGANDSILVVGCGGLGLALWDEFGVQKYTGIEINSLADL